MLYPMEEEVILNTDVASVIEAIFADYPEVISTFFKHLEKINNVRQYAALKQDMMSLNVKLAELTPEAEKKFISDIISFDRLTMSQKKSKELKDLDDTKDLESIEKILDSI